MPLPDARGEDELVAEVVALEGEASVSVGDAVKAGDTIETKADSSVELALDGDFQNIVRIDGDSRVKVESIYPSKFYIEEGDVYARLDALPKGSTFELQSPTAVATVRGTVYRLKHRDGTSEVFNFSGDVEVFTKDESGKLSSEPVRLPPNQRLEMPLHAQAPKMVSMPPEDVRAGFAFTQAVDQHRRVFVAEGKKIKAPPLRDIEKRMNSQNPKPGGQGPQGNAPELQGQPQQPQGPPQQGGEGRPRKEPAPEGERKPPPQTGERRR